MFTFTSEDKFSLHVHVYPNLFTARSALMDDAHQLTSEEWEQFMADGRVTVGDVLYRAVDETNIVLVGMTP